MNCSHTTFTVKSFSTPSKSTIGGNSFILSVTKRKLRTPTSFSDTPYCQEQQQMQNNNKPSEENNSSISEDYNLTRDGVFSSNHTKKRKDEKNVFFRLGLKMGLRLSSFRNKRHVSGNDNNGNNGATMDASAEFVAQSPIHETKVTIQIIPKTNLDDVKETSFTDAYKRFILKKWLDHGSDPNRIMYKASSEMLSQVWYWGEISRLDAQKQLSDKPTGSFLVRDSETRGCQFTLSFRIVNVTLHYRLEYRDNYWHFEELQYESIVEMIEDILYRCTNDNFVCFVKVQNELQPPCPVILKYPLSRYFKMPNLQDLCRRVIQRLATPEEIIKLPIPPKLQEYLSVKRELVF